MTAGRTDLHHTLTSAPAPQVEGERALPVGDIEPGGEWESGGLNITPMYRLPKSTSSGMAREPQRAPHLIWEKKVGAAGTPSQVPIYGAKQQKGRWGLEKPIPTENPGPREEGCSLSLGPAGNVGGQREDKLLSPSILLLLPRSLIPSCPYPYRQRQMVQWPSSHSGSPCPMWNHHSKVPG